MNEIIENRLLSRWAALLPRAPHQVGAIHEADCELVPLGDGRLLALTVDAVDEELEGLYRNPTLAGRMAAVASLSDLAAVGADPIGLLLSAALPTSAPNTELQSRVAMGVAEACRAAGTFVLGGDTSAAPSLRIACVGVGTVPATCVLRRVGLRPGDLLFASGMLGAGAALAGVELLGLEGIAIDFHPPCRLVHGRSLRGIASACIDTSDGLVAALDQLARLNGVAIELAPDLDALLAPSAEAVRRKLGIGAFPFLAAIHGEFELVFGVPPSKLDALAALDWDPIPLGRVTAGEGLRVGSTSIDGAKVRNLYEACDHDVHRYLGALVTL